MKPATIQQKERAMAQYLLSIYQPDGEPPPPSELEKVMKDIYALRRELQAAGAWVFAGGLHPPGTATVVRLRDGNVLTTDGPFVEGKEHVGGFSIIQAADLDAALKWARKYARALTVDGKSGLAIEVRPLQEEH
jgi:hypothetical protein